MVLLYYKESHLESKAAIPFIEKSTDAVNRLKSYWFDVEPVITVSLKNNLTSHLLDPYKIPQELSYDEVVAFILQCRRNESTSLPQSMTWRNAAMVFSGRVPNPTSESATNSGSVSQTETLSGRFSVSAESQCQQSSVSAEFSVSAESQCLSGQIRNPVLGQKNYF